MFVLTVLWITLKRIVSNWKLALALTSGLVLAVGIMVSIPTYATGSLQRSFQQEWIEDESFRPPFTLILAHDNPRRKQPVAYQQLERMRKWVHRELVEAVGDPIAEPVLFASFGSNAVSLPGGRPQGVGVRLAELCIMSNLQALAEVPDGSWPIGRTDGVIQAVVHESTFEREELVIGAQFDYWYVLKEGETIQGSQDGYLKVRIEIVGFFREAPTEEHWIYPPPFSARFFVLPEEFESLSRGKGLRVERYDIQWIFDHRRINVGDLGELIADLNRVEGRAQAMAAGTDFWHSPMEFFVDFHQRFRRISMFLMALGLPTVGMVVFYVALVAGMSVANRRNEVVSMQSRGAGRGQMALSFFLEWLFLAAIAFLVGPRLGLFLAQIMGLCSGFLSFVGRAALPAVLGREAWWFAVVGCFIAVAAGMLPVTSTFRFSVVTFRRRQGRKTRRAVAHRFFADAALLIAAFIAYRELLWQSSGLEPDQVLTADPILLLVPVIFILGAGLALLRLYPLIMSGLAWLVTRLPGVVLQITFRRMTRGGAESMPVLVLLILTLALGIYTSSTARTLAANLEDRVHYEVGADLAMTEDWLPVGDGFGGDTERSYFAEPPFYQRHDLPGVRAAARVFRTRGPARSTGNTVFVPAVDILAVDPQDYAQVAWFRDDLAPSRFREYLGMLARHSEGALVSANLAGEAEISLGDGFVVSHREQPIEVYVAAVIPYWPSLNPRRRPFVILNLSHFQEYTRLEPYEVWYSLDDPAQVQNLVEGLAAELGVYVTEVRDSDADLTALNREPYRVGFYGVLSVGYIVSAIITVMGYAFFTLFSMRRRSVQFAAFRAMGLSGLQLAGVVAIEQLVTVGTGVVLGWGLGQLSATLFLPFLRDRAGDFQRIPPFLIVTSQSDSLRVLAVFVAVFLIGVALVSTVVARMHLGQTVRLGEDQ